MFSEKLRRSIEQAPRENLPDLTAALWKAFAAGILTETDAEELSIAIETRILADRAIPTPRKPVRTGSRPRSSESMERRRRWAASGYMPPPIAARFTLAEAAALAVIAAEAAKRGDCRLAIDHVAALAGVARSSVKRALREARDLGLITIEERRLSRWRSATNVVRIIDRAWSAWLTHRTRRPGGAGQTVPTTYIIDKPCTQKPPRHPVSLPVWLGRSRARLVRETCG